MERILFEYEIPIGDPWTTTTSSSGYSGAFRYRVSPRREDGAAGARAVLGVPPDAPPDVVRKAYRSRLRETHPDLGGSDDAVRRVIEAGRTLGF